MPPAALADEYWSYVLSIAPSWATMLGVHEHDAELEDLSAGAEQQVWAAHLLARQHRV